MERIKNVGLNKEWKIAKQFSVWLILNLNLSFTTRINDSSIRETYYFRNNIILMCMFISPIVSVSCDWRGFELDI